MDFGATPEFVYKSRIIQRAAHERERFRRVSSSPTTTHSKKTEKQNADADVRKTVSVTYSKVTAMPPTHSKRRIGSKVKSLRTCKIYE